MSVQASHRIFWIPVLVIGASMAVLASPSRPAQGAPAGTRTVARAAEHRSASTRFTPLKATDLAELLPWFTQVSIRQVSEATLLRGVVDELKRELKTTDLPDLKGGLGASLATLQHWLEKTLPGAEHAGERGTGRAQCAARHREGPG